MAMRDVAVANNPVIPTLQVFPTATDVAQAVADQFARIARDTIAQRGRFIVALAGGNTPRAAYSQIPADLPWDSIHVFFGDERHVPPDDPASNYGMARESLLSRVPIPEKNVHRVRAELQAETAAQEYEDQLREVCPRAAVPSLDLVLLGMGADGHTASLFPGTPALAERSRLVVANWVEKLKQYRITMTLPVLNAAANVWFVVVGKDKAEVARDVLEGTAGEKYPVQMVKPTSGTVRWMLDAEAAALLSESIRKQAS